MFVYSMRIRSVPNYQDLPNDSEGRELLKVKGEVEAEARFEKSGDGLCGRERVGSG